MHENAGSDHPCGWGPPDAHAAAEHAGIRGPHSALCLPLRKDDELPEFTITRQIDAPIETVWEVLHDFGDIQRWSAGVTNSELTSNGPVGEGSTRHCDFAPFGSVKERVDWHAPNERLTVNINETSRLPISSAVADFNIAPLGGGTELTLHYSYTLNAMGRLVKGYTDKQMRKGIGAMANGLQQESERMATAE